MKVFVLGAGVSKYTACYPLGGELLDALSSFVSEYPVGYKENWAELLRWLEGNKNPDVQLAYTQKRLEHIFTILDLTMRLQEYGSTAALTDRSDTGNTNREHCIAYLEETKNVRQHRHLMLRVLQEFFMQRHCRERDSLAERSALLSFGNRISPGDFVITFNYDASIERVLLHQSKWSPSDGYGFKVRLQAIADEQSRALKKSEVTVLKLHGSVGWYPLVGENGDLDLERQGTPDGPFASNSADDINAQPGIALGPTFLQRLGIDGQDSLFSWTPGESEPVVIHPSFLKDFEKPPFAMLWRCAAEALRKADEIQIIGYSLPAEDQAALTLLQTNCEPTKVEIVNRSRRDCRRLRRLLTQDRGTTDCLSLEEWLKVDE